MNDSAEMMTERYEHMRAMCCIHRKHTQEMELIIGSGMYCWMQAWARCAHSAIPADLLASCCDTVVLAQQSSIGNIAHGEAVGILTSMMWNIVKEEVHVYGD